MKADMRNYDPARTILLFLLSAATACGSEPARSGHGADAAADARVLFDSGGPIDSGIDRRDAAVDARVLFDGVGPADAGTEENAARDAGVGDAGGESLQPSNQGPHFHVGSRLQAQVWTFEGDILLFESWQDTLLGERCSFLDSPETSVPCSPQGDEPRWVHDSADCSGALIPTLAESADAVHTTVGGKIYELDDGAKGTLYSPDSGACIAVTGLVRLRELVPEVVATRFVHATTELRAASERLTVREFVADDGSRQVDALYDTELARRCNRRAMRGDGRTFPACVPITVAFQHGYTDAECSMPLAYVNAGYGFDDPLFVLTGLGGVECGYGARSVTAPFMGDDFYADWSGSCELKTLNEPWVASAWTYSEGAFDLDRLAELEHFLVGEGRIQVYYEGLHGVGPLSPPRLADRWGYRSMRDTLHGFDCRPMPTADGKTRCIPKHSRGWTGSPNPYADPSCETELTRVHTMDFRYEHGCTDHPLGYVAYQDSWPASIISVRELGTQYEGEALYQKSDAGCEPLPLEENGRGRLFELGGEVPLDTFAELELTTLEAE